MVDLAACRRRRWRSSRSNCLSLLVLCRRVLHVVVMAMVVGVCDHGYHLGSLTSSVILFFAKPCPIQAVLVSTFAKESDDAATVDTMMSSYLDDDDDLDGSVGNVASPTFSEDPDSPVARPGIAEGDTGVDIATALHSARQRAAPRSSVASAVGTYVKGSAARGGCGRSLMVPLPAMPSCSQSYFHHG